jgi:Holliday junction resolvasome RuvABC DNA-binding subunit
MQPKLIKGVQHRDERGKIKYNNEFDASEVKRMYTIENADKTEGLKKSVVESLSNLGFSKFEKEMDRIVKEQPDIAQSELIRHLIKWSSR